MSPQPVIAALEAAMEAAGVAFGDGAKPKSATTRYVVAWFDGGTTSDRSLRSRDGWSTVGTFHCYGQTADATRGINGLLTTAILALHGQMAGDRVLLMPEQLTSLPMDRDDKAEPALFDQISEWRFHTTPA